MIELTLYQQQAWFELACYLVVGVYFCVTMSQAKSQQVKSKRDAKERIEVHRKYCEFEDGVVSCIRQSVITCAARKMTSANQSFSNEATELLKNIVKFKWELE
ncbi:hypothetical protein PP410_gp14 [Vibrio phage NF]|uniref:Uncharacterized protein n=1 Tax=Vibrio phage NF TaxID=2686202 RepID=A0A6B9J163_9CAUD|nr:hypothetical protein PP410_gp14 [Vibrio phage NF]QGZ13231.1 hypothetical protein [Vibrio phage NF]